MSVFEIEDSLAGPESPRLISASELRSLCNDLELHGAYQILAWKHDADRGGQIEIVVTYEKPK